jgi:hypothetical protein
MNSNSSQVGAYISPKVGNVPLANSAGTRNGTAVDRDGFDSCVLHGQTGASTGTPTSFTYALKLQESDDGSTGWADITGAAITTVTAASTAAKVNVNLSGSKRYIRAVETIAFVGGTSPTLAASSVIVLGGPDSLPTT